MLYYSIVPGDQIFAEDNEDLELKEIELGGIKLLVRLNEEHQGEIVRVISSNPSDYLNAFYQPGDVLDFSWQIKN